MKTKRESSTANNLNVLHNSTVSLLKERLSGSKKDVNKRMSVADEVPVPGGLASKQEMSSISHAASLPVLSCSSCAQQRHEVEKLKLEVADLRGELKNTKSSLEASQKTVKVLRERLSSDAQKQIKLSERFEDLTLGNNRPTALVQQYGMLYSQTRVDALDSLDSMSELTDLDNLKNKLLFSIIVLSFRQCQQRKQQIKEKILSVLGVKKSKTPSTNLETAVKDTERCITECLRQTMDSYDIKPLIQDVQMQIFSTLYDYPCLKACDKLKQFIAESVQISWKLTVINPPCHLEFDCKNFDPNKHIRFHSSNGESSQVRIYVWPALIETKTAFCLYKGTVIT